MQLQSNFNFLNSAKQLWNGMTSRHNQLVSSARNSGATVYGAIGPTNAPRANGNYQRYLQSRSQLDAVASGQPVLSDTPVVPGADTPSSPASAAANASAAYLNNIGGSSAKTFDYVNADLARQYAMSRETAYQEALSNTSYQRSIADMKAAGLNPAALFGAGRVSGADGVSYVASADSGSSGAGFSPSRYSHGSAKSGYAINNGLYNLLSAAGAGIGYLATRRMSGAYTGSAVAKQLMRIYNGFAQQR